jgi:hypothetical protein
MPNATPFPVVTAADVLALKGVRARNAVTRILDPAEVEVLLNEDTRKLILAAAQSRLNALRRAAAPTEPEPGPEAAPEPRSEPEPAPPEVKAPEVKAPEVKAAPEATAEILRGHRACTHEGCTHVGPIDEDFGYRKVNGKRYAQPWCRPCRRGSAKAANQKALDRMHAEAARLNRA